MSECENGDFGILWCCELCAHVRFRWRMGCSPMESVIASGEVSSPHILAHTPLRRMSARAGLYMPLSHASHVCTSCSRTGEARPCARKALWIGEHQSKVPSALEVEEVGCVYGLCARSVPCIMFIS